MAGTEPTLFEVTGNEANAKPINAIARRDKGITGYGAPFIHTNFNTASYMQVARNQGSGGNLLQYKRSDNSANLKVNDAGLTIDYAVVMSQMTAGSIPYVGTSQALTEDHPFFYWDAVNKNLGVGTGATAPLQTLHVFGGARVDGTTLNVDATNHRVGVGLTAPSAMLDIYGVGRIQNDTGAPTTGRGLELQYNTSGNYGAVVAFNRGATTHDALRLIGSSVLIAASATGMAFVNQTGVGIRTTSPTVDLDVNGTANVSGGITADTTTFRVDPVNHRVGVRQTTPLAIFDVLGNANVSDMLRVQGNTSTPTTGEGIEFQYNQAGHNGIIFPYNRVSTTMGTMFYWGNPSVFGLGAAVPIGFYGGGGATQQAVGTTAATSSAALTLLNKIHDALVAVNLVTS